MRSNTELTLESPNEPGLSRPVDAAIVACAGGLVGFLVGAFAFPGWHHAIETAQTYSLNVIYPPTAPDFIYHAKAWDLIHQTLAVLMRWFVSDATLAMGLSGAVGMVSYMAISLSVFAISEDRFLSIVSAPIAHFALSPLAAQPYIAQLMGQGSSYGPMALGLGVMAVALMSLGNRRLAAFIFGLLPAIHFLFAVYFWLTALAGTVWRGRKLGDLFRVEAPFFMAGFAVTAASLAGHVGAMPKFPDPGDMVEQARHFHAFLTHWSPYHIAIQYQPAYLVNWAVALIALIWIALHDWPATSRSLVRTLFVSALVAGALTAATWLTEPHTPDLLREAVPGRFLSISIIAFAPMVMGMLGHPSGGTPARICLVLLVGTITLVRWLHLPYEAMTILVAGVVYLSAGFLFAGLFSAGKDRESVRTRSEGPGSGVRVSSVLERAVLVILVMVGPVPWFAQAYWGSVGERHLNCAVPGPLAKEDPVIRALRHRKGPVVASSVEFAQLVLRRPVIASSDLTSLINMPEASPKLEKVLRRIYGIDSFHPADAGNYSTGPPRDMYRRTWENRSLEEWMRIRKEFGVIDVLTCGDWRLRLPQIGASETFTAYTIPVGKARR